MDRATVSGTVGCRFDSCQGHVKKERIGICRFCGRTRKFHAQDAYYNCFKFHKYEGTLGKFYGHEGSNVQERAKVKLREYNRLVGKGWLQREIAVKWGVSVHAVKMFAGSCRRNGWVVQARPVQQVPKTIVEPKLIRKAGNIPHGGGAAGRHGCHCEPCRIKRNKYNSAYGKAQRLKAKMERESGKPP